MKGTPAVLGLRQLAVFNAAVGVPMAAVALVLVDSTGRIVLAAAVAVLAILHFAVPSSRRFETPPAAPDGMAAASASATFAVRVVPEAAFAVLVLASVVIMEPPIDTLFLGTFGLVFCSGALVQLIRARAIERWERGKAARVLQAGGLFSLKPLYAVPLASSR
jgi:hypothetical protein